MLSTNTKSDTPNLSVLQLSGSVSSDRLKLEYQASQARYLRLTACGPLRYYRDDLLAALDRAYYSLKRPVSMKSRQISYQRKLSGEGGVKSANAKTSILQKNLRIAEKDQVRDSSDQVASEQRQQAQIEDKLCLEVIYRLEGDLIRYDSRRELLRIAREEGIPLFRANLLIAQIVEAVRQNKLYKPSACERACQIKKESVGTMKRSILVATVVAAVLAIAVDLLLLYYLA